MAVLDLFKLDGKRALVTGGGQGIGRGFALALAEAGAAVAVIDINPTTAAKVAAEIEARCRPALAVACDVTDPDDVRRAVEQVVERFGGLDIAVNNAGKVIILNGTVPSADQRAAAERVAKIKAAGYRVDNRLTVAPKR